MTQVPIATQGTMEGVLRAIKDIKQVLLGRVTFGDNISIRTVDITTSITVGDDIAVPHNLDHIPTGFIAYGVDMPAHIYKSSTPWTQSQIFVKSDTSPLTFQIIIF